MCPLKHLDMINKLGEYLFQRICNDQGVRKRPKKLGTLHKQKDIQQYVWDYFNIGLDETGTNHQEKYWDDRDENY